MQNPLKVYRLAEVPDEHRYKVIAHYARLEDAQAAGAEDERRKPLVPGCRFEWFPAPGSPRRWSLHVYAPGLDVPDVTDYLITEIGVIGAQEASQPDEAAPRSIRPVIEHALTVYYDGNAELVRTIIDRLLDENRPQP